MKKWTHNRTGSDYYELGRGQFVATGQRVNDYDFVVGYLMPNNTIEIRPQPAENGVPEEYRGCTVYFGQMQTENPVKVGTILVVYKSVLTGKIWFRPESEWAERFTCILDVGK